MSYINFGFNPFDQTSVWYLRITIFDNFCLHPREKAAAYIPMFISAMASRAVLVFWCFLFLAVHPRSWWNRVFSFAFSQSKECKITCRPTVFLDSSSFQKSLYNARTHFSCSPLVFHSFPCIAGGGFSWQGISHVGFREIGWYHLQLPWSHLRWMENDSQSGRND